MGYVNPFVMFQALRIDALTTMTGVYGQTKNRPRFGSILRVADEAERICRSFQQLNRRVVCATFGSEHMQQLREKNLELFDRPVSTRTQCAFTCSPVTVQRNVLDAPRHPAD